MSALDAQELSLIAAITRIYALSDSPSFCTPSAFNAILRSGTPKDRGARFTHDRPDTCMYIARSKNANVVAYTANFVDCDGTDAEDGTMVASEIQANDPIHAYFVNLEPSYVAERRRKGIVGDCDDLNMLERRLAYGCRHKMLKLSTDILELLNQQYVPCDDDDDSRRAEMAQSLMEWWSVLQPFAVHFVALPSLSGVLLRLPPLLSGAHSESDTCPHSGSSSSEARTLPVILAVINGELSVLERVYVKSVERWMRLPYVEYIEIFGVSIDSGKLTYEKKMNDGSTEPPQAESA